MTGLLSLDPAAYAPSALHHPDCTFRETNCYVDLWIELLHAQGIDPASAMSFVCTVDFEGDQWTFFKPPPDHLRYLYGIDVHEMQLYRPTVDHVMEQLQRGRTLIIEVDSFYLPDTSTTAYQRAHVKSSIAIEAIDPASERLRYFHGSGYYVLPPYAEVVRFDAGARLESEDLRRAAYELLRQQLARRPARNPWLEFGERLAVDVPALIEGVCDCHAYAFATVRQCGAAFELAQSFVQWLAPTCSHADTAAGAFGRMSGGAKALLFRLARRRMFDPAAAIGQLAADWETAIGALDCLSLGVGRHA
jgi:hypothetical protein